MSKKGMDRRRLSEASGVGESTLSELFNGKRNSILSESLTAIHRALDLPPPLPPLLPPVQRQLFARISNLPEVEQARLLAEILERDRKKH
jgi:transcriptional regulator with XRE-family HTH domain